jgi:23S rRNA pseudouridine2605 synthase
VSPRVIELTLREGRNRQVRRMAEAIGNEVVSLVRVRFGPLGLGDLPEGEARRLRPAQLRRLWKDARP